MLLTGLQIPMYLPIYICLILFTVSQAGPARDQRNVSETVHHVPENVALIQNDAMVVESEKNVSCNNLSCPENSTEELHSEKLSSLPPSSSTLMKTRIFLHKYVFSVITCVGIICNILVLVVWNQEEFENSPRRVYMSFLAGSNLVQLLTRWFAFRCFAFARYSWYDSSYKSSNVAMRFLYLSSICFDVLLVLAVTVEWCICISQPSKATERCTVKKARVVSLSLLVFACLLQISGLFQRMGITTENDMENYIYLALVSIPPYFILGGCNIKSITVMRGAMKSPTRGYNSGGFRSTRFKEIQVTKMVRIQF